MNKKICKICNKEKEINNFTHAFSKRNGNRFIYYYKTCKDCDRLRINAKNKRSKEKHRKKLALNQRMYHASHKKQDSITKKIWYLKNREHVSLKNKICINNRRKNDIIFKLKENMSAYVRSFIFKNKKSIKKYLPYTIEELKKHLESQFEPWMTWNNWGKYYCDKWDDDDSSTWTWQIDHIIPHSTFKYVSMEDEEFKKCWSLNNLRPYSAKQNLLDGNRR